MATKFTPGPWKRGSTFELSIFGGQVEVAIAGGNGSEMANANANLIAAAPDLLAALESIVTAIEYVDVLKGSKGAEILRKCYAAIERARGEQS